MVMKRIKVEKEFDYYLEIDPDKGISDDVQCTLHHIDFDNSDAGKETVGFLNISIEGSKTYQRHDFPIHGIGFRSAHRNDFSNCVYYLPQMLEKSSNDEGVLCFFRDFVVIGEMVTEEDLGIKMG
jgi:hypothetical protein